MSEGGLMPGETENRKTRSADWGLVVLAWALVSIPLAWGVLMTLKKAAQLFGSSRSFSEVKTVSD